MNHDENEYLLITYIIFGQKCILEQLLSLSYGLYQTTIRSIESYYVMNQKFNDSNAFLLWHERLGHPGISMMRRIVQNSNGHPLTSRQILVTDGYTCAACSKCKLIIRPSFTKTTFESPAFLEHIQGDICGPIHPPSRPFRYFMALIDASTRWSHVCLLSSRNVAFAIFADCHFDENIFSPLGEISQFHKNGDKLYGMSHLYLTLIPVQSNLN